jgi:hypothetical protein
MRTTLSRAPVECVVMLRGSGRVEYVLVKDRFIIYVNHKALEIFVYLFRIERGLVHYTL